MKVGLCRQLMYFIENFVANTSKSKTPRKKRNILVLTNFCQIFDILKLKVCTMVAANYPKVFVRLRCLITAYVIDTEDVIKDFEDGGYEEKG